MIDRDSTARTQRQELGMTRILDAGIRTAWRGAASEVIGVKQRLFLALQQPSVDNTPSNATDDRIDHLRTTRPGSGTS